MSDSADHVSIRKSARSTVPGMYHRVVLPVSKLFKRGEEHFRIAARKIVSAVSRGKECVAANEITAAIEAN